MLVCAETVCFVVDPFAVVDVAIYMYKLSLPMRPIIPPFSNILSTIRPFLFPKPISKPTNPLPFKRRSCFKTIFWSHFSLRIRIINSSRYRFTRFIHREISTCPTLCVLQEIEVLSIAVSTPESLEFDY